MALVPLHRSPSGRRVGTLADGTRVVAHSVKCYAVGCRSRREGLLARGDGRFFSSSGRYLANLREQDYCCRDHGVAGGSAPFLHRDE